MIKGVSMYAQCACRCVHMYIYSIRFMCVCMHACTKLLTVHDTYSKFSCIILDLIICTFSLIAWDRVSCMLYIYGAGMQWL